MLAVQAILAISGLLHGLMHAGQYLLTLIIASTHAGTTRAAHGINLVHEDNAWSVLLSLRHMPALRHLGTGHTQAALVILKKAEQVHETTQLISSGSDVSH